MNIFQLQDIKNYLQRSGTEDIVCKILSENLI